MPVRSGSTATDWGSPRAWAINNVKHGSDIFINIRIGRSAGLADDLLAFDSLLFLVATLASYMSLRRLDRQRLHLVERIADAAFIVAMLLLTVSCFVITYALSA